MHRMHGLRRVGLPLVVRCEHPTPRTPGDARLRARKEERAGCGRGPPARPSCIDRSRQPVAGASACCDSELRPNGARARTPVAHAQHATRPAECASAGRPYIARRGRDRWFLLAQAKRGCRALVCAQTREGLAGRHLFASDEERAAGLDVQAGAPVGETRRRDERRRRRRDLWRYPVKSMGGERLAQSAIAARGLHADRMWAVRDAELSPDTFTTARRWPVLLQCSARFAEDPADRSAGPGTCSM